MKLDPTVLESLFADRTPGADAARAGAENDSAAAEPGRYATNLPTAAFSPAAVAIEPDDVEAHHALALFAARQGDLEGARKTLGLLAEKKPAEPETTRIARDLSRLEQLIRLRDGFLASLKQSGAKWTLEFDGRKVIATIVDVKDGVVNLGENKQGVAVIPLTGIAPLEIAKQADKKEEQGSAEPWARSYAYLLAGDPKWDKAPKDPSEGARLLREDAKAWIADLVREGEAAKALDALARLPLPRSAEEGAAMVEPIRKLVTTFGDVVLVQKRLEPLKRLASAALEPTWVEQDPSTLVHGKYTFMGDGRVNVVYDFDRKEEGEDFKKWPGYLREWRKPMHDQSKKEEQSTWSVQDGAFRGVGSACYGYSLGFAAPMTVRYDLTVVSGEMADKARPCFMVGICDDGKGSDVMAMNWGDLRVVDQATRFEESRTRKQNYMYFLDTGYHLELRHDGTTASTWVEGEKAQEAPCGPRKGGGVFLWFQCDIPIAITRLEIEGRLDASTRERMRGEWVKSKLAGMGFK